MPKIDHPPESPEQALRRRRFQNPNVENFRYDAYPSGCYCKRDPGGREREAQILQVLSPCPCPAVLFFFAPCHGPGINAQDGSPWYPDPEVRGSVLQRASRGGSRGRFQRSARILLESFLRQRSVLQSAVLALLVLRGEVAGGRRCRRDWGVDERAASWRRARKCKDEL